MTISQQYADELGRQIDELEDENERLRKALEPFAAYHLRAVGFNGVFSQADMNDFQWMAGFDGPQPEYRHFDAARAALNAQTTPPVSPKDQP